MIASAAVVLRPAAGNTILDEDFEDPPLDTTVWNTCYWWGCTIASNDELQWYEPAQAKVADGQLNLTAEAVPVKTADGESFPYRSGMISSGPAERGAKPRFSFTYGTVEARLRVPAGQGLWSALWMLPAFGDSRPEVDIVEVLGHDTRTSYQTLHREDRDSKPFQGTNRGPDLADGWHIYRLDWLPRELRWYIDGHQVFTVKGKEVPDEPMYLIVNLAVGGRWPGSPDEFTRFPASLSVDYIRVRSWNR
jgi:beta-glucanase (GH16 family)